MWRNTVRSFVVVLRERNLIISKLNSFAKLSKQMLRADQTMTFHNRGRRGASVNICFDRKQRDFSQTAHLAKRDAPEFRDLQISMVGISPNKNLPQLPMPRTRQTRHSRANYQLIGHSLNSDPTSVMETRVKTILQETIPRLDYQDTLPLLNATKRQTAPEYS